MPALWFSEAKERPVGFENDGLVREAPPENIDQTMFVGWKRREGSQRHLRDSWLAVLGGLGVILSRLVGIHASIQKRELAS
jgi:hypothetical protein